MMFSTKSRLPITAVKAAMKNYSVTQRVNNSSANSVRCRVNSSRFIFGDYNAKALTAFHVRKFATKPLLLSLEQRQELIPKLEATGWVYNHICHINSHANCNGSNKANGEGTATKLSASKHKYPANSYRDEIKKTYEFDNFVKCFGFMTKIAIVAEKMDHHPEWFNVYNKLEVTLSTHDCGGLSLNDIRLASILDQIYTEKY